MILSDVTGEMVSTEKHASLNGRRILTVRPINADGETTGTSFLAIDAVGAGVGDRVLVNHEGHAPMEIFGLAEPPIRSLIVCVVDCIEVGGKITWRKTGSS